MEEKDDDDDDNDADECFFVVRIFSSCGNGPFEETFVFGRIALVALLFDNVDVGAVVVVLIN